jgi:hypothetical protein
MVPALTLAEENPLEDVRANVPAPPFVSVPLPMLPPENVQLPLPLMVVEPGSTPPPVTVTVSPVAELKAAKSPLANVAPPVQLASVVFQLLLAFGWSQVTVD